MTSDIYVYEKEETAKSDCVRLTKKYKDSLEFFVNPHPSESHSGWIIVARVIDRPQYQAYYREDGTIY